MFRNKNSRYHIQLYGDYSSRTVAFFGKASGPKIHSLQERLIVILYTITLRVKILKENHTLFGDTNPLRPNKVSKCPELGI